MIAHSIMYVNVKKAGINLGQLDLGWGGGRWVGWEETFSRTYNWHISPQSKLTTIAKLCLAEA